METPEGDGGSHLIPSVHLESLLLSAQSNYFKNLKCRYLFIEGVMKKIHRSKKVLFLSLESISGLRRTLVVVVVVGGGWQKVIIVSAPGPGKRVLI